LSEISLDQLTSYRTQVEEKIKNELNKVYSPLGIICNGFLLSEVKDLGSLKSSADDKVILSVDQKETK
jgi:hypothetical protein